MGAARTGIARRQAWRASAQCRLAEDPQRHLLCAAQWLPMAHAAAPLRPLVHGLCLLSSMAARWDLGAPADHAPRTRASPGGAGADAQRRHPGQPVGQDRREGGSAATTAARRSKVANGTCWWIPKAGCSRWWSTRPTCRTATGAGRC